MTIRLAAACLLLAAAASAQILVPQPFSITGTLRPVPTGPPLSCAPGTHQIECAEGLFQLQSRTVDLSLHEGANVRLTVAAFSALCPILEVLAVEPDPPVTLTLCGSGGLGCPVVLHSTPGGGGFHYLFVSASPGLVPVSVASGSLMLGEPFLLLAVGNSAFEPTGFDFAFTVPNNPALVGVTAYMQVARQEFGPVGFPQPPVRWSNVRCLEITGRTGTCEPADCLAF